MLPTGAGKSLCYQLPALFLPRPVVVVSPLISLMQASGVSLFVIDDAHCISEWGHDFRPAYLSLRHAIRTVGRPPVLALTATATPRVIDDVVRQLDLRDAAIVNTGIERPNLVFEVFLTVNDDAKRARLRHLAATDPVHRAGR